MSHRPTLFGCSIHNETKQTVAIKHIGKNRFSILVVDTLTESFLPCADLEDSDDDISEIQQEIAHLAQCDSEYVTKYYGSFVKGYKLWIGKCYRVHDRNYSHELCTVMEYLAGGSCLDLVRPSAPMPNSLLNKLS